MPYGYEELDALEALRQQINLQLNQLPLSPRQVAAKIAWMRDGSDALPSVDGDKFGQEVIFPIEWPGEEARILRIGEDPGSELMERAKFSVIHNAIAPKKKLIPEQTRLNDVYGIFDKAAPKLVQNAYRWIERYMAALLGNGQNAVTKYDNVTFFHATNHLANPNRSRGKKFGNLLAATAADRAGYEAAAQILDEMPGPDGEIGDWDGRIVALCSTRKQFRRLRTIANGTIVPSEAGTASESNIYSMDGEFDVMYWPQLGKYDNKKAWYLLKIVDDKFRPFCASIARPPFLYTEGITVNDANYCINGNAFYGWKMYAGFGYLFPQLAIKILEP